MSAVVRTVNMVAGFLEGLVEIQEYHGQQNPARGRKVTSALINFAYDIVGPFPQAYPVYAVPQHPDREYRRAVYRREYVLIYRVTEEEVTFLLVYGTRQNSENFALPE